MTPQELYAALDARRRERGEAWWQVILAIQAPAPSAIRAMWLGSVSAPLRQRAEAWLTATRKQVPPPTQ